MIPGTTGSERTAPQLVVGQLCVPADLECPQHHCPHPTLPTHITILPHRLSLTRRHPSSPNHRQRIRLTLSQNKRSRLSVCGGRRSGVQTPPPIATTTRLTWVSFPMSHNAPICDEHEEVSNLHKDDEAVEEQDWTYVPFTFRHFIHPQPALSLFDANGKLSASSLDLVSFALSGESGARLACSCKTPSSATPLSRAHPNIV